MFVDNEGYPTTLSLGTRFLDIMLGISLAAKDTWAIQYLAPVCLVVGGIIGA